MYEVEVICDYCKKEFERPSGRVNEAEKFGWKQFCSLSCQSKSKTKEKILTFCKLCNKTVIRSKSSISKTGDVFCSSSCSITYSNTHRVTKFTLAKRKRLLKKPICANPHCEKQIGIENKIYCSPECRFYNENEKNRQRVVTEIRNFFKKYDRIPMKSELPALCSRGRHGFGTWNQAIQAAGFIPNEVIFSKKFTANDGHTCDSLSEKIIDDWLFARKIIHEIHVKYPWNNGMSADFKVGEYWIEFFGLAGQLKRYDFLKSKKLKLTKQYNLKVIYLYLSDLFPVNMLNQKLKQIKRMQNISCKNNPKELN